MFLELNKNEHSSRTSYTQGFHTVLISKICPYFESLHSTSGKILLSLFLEMSLFLACVLIWSCLDFLTKLRVICLALFFVLPSKLYCDIIKAPQSYLEHKEANHMGMKHY